MGEAGGYDEHRLGRPFVGKAGIVLNTYLGAVGIRRRSLYVDNVYPYWTGPGNPDPTAEQIEEGGERLRRTLRIVRPEIVGCLGRIAAQWFLGEEFASIKRDHGIVYSVRKEGLDLLVIPCTHPAAGFYDPSAAARCQEDLGAVAATIRGEKKAWEEVELPESELVEHPSPRSAYPVPIPGSALDTEGSVWKPQMISWASPSGSYVSRWTVGCGAPLLPSRLTMHYALHDLAVLRAMGADADPIDYDDTMLMAFDLMGGGQDNTGEDRASPLGLSLKNLAYRELQVRMQDFKDLVRPYYNKRVASWIDDLLDRELPPKSETELKAGTGKNKGKLVFYTPQPPRRRFGAVLLEAITGGEPEKRWWDLPESMRKLGEERMGERFPTISTAIELVPEKKAVKYAGADAWTTRKLEGIYRERLKERGLERVYEIDRKALPFVDEFIRNGMPYSKERVVALRTELEEKQERLTRELRKLVGNRGFNPGSRDDVAEFLYRKHKLVAPKETKGGQESTDAKSIAILRAQVGQEETGSGKTREEVIHFLDCTLAYREAQKMRGTFVRYVEEETKALTTERLHPSDISYTRVMSGRLSGMLLTFPQRTELGSRLRALFVAGKGKRILSLDYSQLELRIAAELSGDPTMKRAFKEGQDLHDLTGSALFKTKDPTRLKKTRPVSKQVNFSTLYGISDRALWEKFALAGIFDYTVRQCQGFIDGWFELYSGIVEYQRRLWKDAEKTGEVRDWCGRVRYVPNIRIPEGSLKAEARRDVGNFPIQAGGRELVKIAEGELVPWLRRVRGLVSPILDIHDELLFEVDEEVVEEAADEVQKVMLREGRERFEVPIEVGRHWGGDWAEAK